MINVPNRPIYSVPYALNAEPARPSFCQHATQKPCSFISTKSQQKSPQTLTPFYSSIKPDGMAPKPSRFRATSRSCHCRRAHPSSTAKKISGSSCARTGFRTASSNPSTTSSTTAATPGTLSPISRGRSCPLPTAIGQSSVTLNEDWYKFVKPRDQRSIVIDRDGAPFLDRILVAASL